MANINDAIQSLNKFGVGSIQTILTDIWSAADGTGQAINTKPVPSNDGQKLYVSSSSVDDTELGTGAQSVVISGTDEDFLPVEERLVLNGQTQVESKNIYTRVCRMYVEDSGTESGALGTIYAGDLGATNGVPDNDKIYAIISEEVLTGSADFSPNQTQQACFTVPNGYVAKMDRLDVSLERTSADVVFYIRTRDLNNPKSAWRVRENVYLGSSGINSREYDDQKPVFQGKTDIQISAIASSNDQEAAASFDLGLVRVKDIAARMNGLLTTSDFTDVGFKVSWNDVLNTAFSDGFTIEVEDEATGWKKDFSVSSSITEFVFKNLIKGHTYTVRVSNTFGTGTSAPLESTGNVVTDTTTLSVFPHFSLMGVALGDFTYSTDQAQTVVQSSIPTGNVTSIGLLGSDMFIAADDDTGYKLDPQGNIEDVTGAVTWSIVVSTRDGSYIIRQNGGTTEYSFDGENWLTATVPVGAVPSTEFIYENAGQYYAMFDVSGTDTILKSADGITWTTLTANPSFTPERITMSGNRLVASGSDGTTVSIEYSDDGGDTWTAGTCDAAGNGAARISSMAVDSAGWFYVEFENIAGGFTYLGASSDGTAFTQVTTTYLSLGVIPVGDTTYVVEADGANLPTSTDVYLTPISTGVYGTPQLKAAGVTYGYSASSFGL